MFRFTSTTDEIKPVISLWTNEYGVEIDIVQDPYGICLEITINDGKKEITYSISDDQELQQGAYGVCEEGHAKCERERLSRKNK